MQYIQVVFSFDAIETYQQDLLISDLAEIGFNTFEDTDSGFAAFIDAVLFSEQNLVEMIKESDPDLSYSYAVTEIAGENWNEEWEKNFEPLIISDLCYVRATFHEPKPQYTYEIVIDPKMAFGTGHHQTTTMMMEYILSNDVKNTTVLDMGCGTGILAILASMKGATTLVAIDNDEVCYESTKENSTLNNIENIKAICGGKEVIPNLNYDVILANINRNILLDQIPVYAEVLKNSGHIFFSGFYESPDLEMIKSTCETLNIKYQSHKKNGEWVAAHFIKE